MYLNIHRIESVVVDQIETIEHDDGRKTYVRSIIIKNYQRSFPDAVSPPSLSFCEIKMFSNDINTLKIKEQS